jgi:hypothetical protein
MPHPNDGFLWKGLAAISALVSIATLCCAVLLVVGRPTLPREAAAWLEDGSGGLTAKLSSLRKSSVEGLAALRQRLRAFKAPWRRNEIDLNTPPAITLGWLSREYPEAVWSPPPVATRWSPTEITTALKDCLKSLAPLGVDVEPLSPIRSGACGMPAPVLLRSLGRNQKVTVQPPATINCQMVAALIAGWKKQCSRAPALPSARLWCKLSGHLTRVGTYTIGRTSD